MSVANFFLQKPVQDPLSLLAAGEDVIEQEGFPALYYWLWLAEVLGPAHKKAGEVIATFGGAAAAYAARESAAFEKIVGKTVVRNISGLVIDAKACAERVEQCQAKEIAILTYEDYDYPLALTKISDPPLVLYCTGDVSALSAPAMVGMVGTRRPTQYGVAAAERFGKELAASGAVIVSGLADGLDGECHRAALVKNTPTVGVLGVPITKTFPATNRTLRNQIEAKGGVTISEYHPDFDAGRFKSTFLQRNRIIAALSDVLVVLEARLKSGTMSTVGHAERYGTPIYAVPGSVFSALSEGTNELLRAGRAKALVDAADLRDLLGLQLAPPPAAPQRPLALSPMAKQVLSHIGATPIGMAGLQEKSGLSVGLLLSALTSLELAGCIISLPGRQYILK